jgi:hypothetical protein
LCKIKHKGGGGKYINDIERKLSQYSTYGEETIACSVDGRSYRIIGCCALMKHFAYCMVAVLAFIKKGGDNNEV